MFSRLRPLYLTGTILGIAWMVLAVPAQATTPVAKVPTLIGFTAGDDWEPAVASDTHGDVYVVWAHFGNLTNCTTCGSSIAMLEISRDAGRTFGPPTVLAADPQPQVDVNVAVNGTGAVFVTYLLGNATVIQRSDDRGGHWSSPLTLNPGLTGGGTDKPGLAVSGTAVYVAYDVAGVPFFAVSHDGGRKFHTTHLAPSGLGHGFSLNSGGVVASNGSVYYAWVGVHNSGTTLSPQEVYVTRSTDGGRNWTVLPVASTLPRGPTCPTSCGYDFLGPQMVVAVDKAGTLYVLYNAGTVKLGAPSVWFSTSTDQGANWSRPIVASTDGTPSYHAFPAIAAGPAGRVYISWMDNSTGAYNVWVRTSSTSGTTFGPEIQVSAYRSGLSYVNHTGFAFPYGDYFILNANPNGHLYLAWGEGPNWVGPGNVFFNRI